MLIKRTERQARNRTLADALQTKTESNVDRRAFLRRSGLVAGGLAAVGALPLLSVRKSEAAHPRQPGAEVTIRKSICTFCSVGCTVLARSLQRSVGWPGARLGLAAQSRLALRQRRGGT